MALNTVELRPRIGTEVRADKAALLGGAHGGELRELLERRGVLVFRELGLDDEEQLAFSATLGEVQPTLGLGVFKISFEKSEASTADFTRGSFVWHIDRTNEDYPTFASILSARRLAAHGGQTEFANTYAAWEDLPPGEQRRLEGLKVVHSVEAGMRRAQPNATEEQAQRWRQTAPKVHPLVWTHRSGRKSLVLGSTAAEVVGMPPAEGRALLAELQAWATQPQFVYRHEWTLGDLLVWDNTGSMHRVEPYAEDSGRLMHRTTLLGEEPLA